MQSNVNYLFSQRKMFHLQLMQHLQTQRKAQKVDKETCLDMREVSRHVSASGL